ncbi:MAG: hypothetical protein AAFQ63_11455, partial [Cyanobacteria bacterium J06621_11]
EVALEEASDTPDSVDVLALWRQFERELSDLPQRDRLRVAGDILMELAGLCEIKADLLWEDWQDAHNADGPVMGGDWLQGVTRQTQELDFSSLVQRSYRVKEQEFDSAIDDSIVGAVDKTSALALVEALDEAELKTQALSVSHAENVSDWIEQLSAAQQDTPQRLVDLQERLKMPLVTVWLAALLGGFCVDQRGGFYDTTEVWISAS